MKLSQLALAAALGVASLPAVAQNLSDAGAQGASERQQVSALSTRPAGNGCVYRSSVTGTVRVRGDAPHAAVRDADLRTRAAIVCNGREVSVRDDRVVLPEATVETLNARITKGLAIAPPGDHCVYSHGLRIDAGRVQVDQPVTACKVLPNPPASARQSATNLQPWPAQPANTPPATSAPAPRANTP